MFACPLEKPRNIPFSGQWVWWGFSHILGYLSQHLSSPSFLGCFIDTKEGWISSLGSLLLRLFILPVLVSHTHGKISRSSGRYHSCFRTLLTAGSVFLVEQFLNMVLLLCGGLEFHLDVVCHDSAKAQSAENMNEFLAMEKHQKQIDSNASSGTMMLVENAGNIVGPVLGGGWFRFSVSWFSSSSEFSHASFVVFPQNHLPYFGILIHFAITRSKIQTPKKESSD